MRDGVSESNPWGKYDPSGIEILNENQKNLDAELTQISSSKKKSENMVINDATNSESKGGVAGTDEKHHIEGVKTKAGSGGIFSGIFGSSTNEL